MFYFHSQDGRTVGTVALLASTCEFADSTVLSRVSILMRDIDIANLSICPSVRPSVTFWYHLKTAVEFYLYPTVGTVLIHSVKPELTE